MTSENVLATLSRATPMDIVAGASWYTDAHALAGSLTADITVGAAVIAVMSPQTSWKINQAIAIRAFQTGIVTGGLGASRAKAQRIMSGEPALSVLGGNKVRSFFANIMDPHGDAVTLDRHAFSVLVGRNATAAESSKVLARKGEYDRLSDMYRTAASRVGISAPTLQAITWCVWRNEKGLTWAG